MAKRDQFGHGRIAASAPDGQRDLESACDRRRRIDAAIHVLDPRTGMPGKHLRSVTVFCPDAELADALSTAMTFDPQRALTMAAALDDVEIVLVDSAGAVHVSAGLDGRLEMAANTARER